MLAVRARLVPPRCRQPSNKRFFIQSLCDGFLDLAIALPYPPSVPAYSTTIIVVTVASRVALFPLALWGRNNLRRLEDVVLPEFERSKPIVSRQILNDVKRLSINNKQITTQALQQLHLQRTREKLKEERKRLLAEHKCHPMLAILVGAGNPTPRLCRHEPFFTLTSLNHPDSTWTIPIILGIVTMANVESNHWFMRGVQKTRMEEREEHAAAEGKRA
ncbi:hypothetical protein FB45DRAFT_1023658 [Roridomyces roridus]|uniref:Uncharacterized protein n=1 Tax=Roridomyces roridus TaxID=1738132 RepID=A0AAD7C4V0_9AGAR|nr:hypothetical protein FB45DRAFT_1023658 [Roridomyces roridus]